MPLELDARLRTIHQPVRLGIMTLVFRERDVAFAQARDALGLTDGNFGAHAKILTDQGFIEGRKVLQRHGFQMRYAITEEGSDAFRDYLTRLAAFLADIDASKD